jgi:hypothetical protein
MFVVHLTRAENERLDIGQLLVEMRNLGERCSDNRSLDFGGHENVSWPRSVIVIEQTGARGESCRRTARGLSFIPAARRPERS